jgi:putative ABC transport system permease protein
MPLDKDALENLRIDRSADARHYGSIPRHLPWIAAGVLGGLIAYFGFNGYQANTMNWASFSQLTFAVTITPRLLITGTIYALILAFIGGLLPGIRAARLPITTGLREL